MKLFQSKLLHISIDIEIKFIQIVHDTNFPYPYSWYLLFCIHDSNFFVSTIPIFLYWWNNLFCINDTNFSVSMILTILYPWTDSYVSLISVLTCYRVVNCNNTWWLKKLIQKNGIMDTKTLYHGCEKSTITSMIQNEFQFHESEIEFNIYAIEFHKRLKLEFIPIIKNF